VIHRADFFLSLFLSPNNLTDLDFEDGRLGLILKLAFSGLY
jgi:hypothetical protein